MHHKRVINRFINFSIAVVLFIGAFAAVADNRMHSPSAEQVQAMSRLHHWIGLWHGGGWAMSGPDRRHDTRVTERVSGKLAGSVLTLEGRGTTTTAEGREYLSHNAFGVVSYDPQARRYNLRTYDMSGHVGDHELVVEEDGLMRWGFEEPESGALLRFEIRIDGDTWHEIGHVSPDGGENWYPMLDMTLHRNDDRQATGQ